MAALSYWISHETHRRYDDATPDYLADVGLVMLRRAKEVFAPDLIAQVPSDEGELGEGRALVAALSPLSSSGSKSADRRDDRPAASSPEPADTSRRLWPHPGRVRSTRAATLTTDRFAATTATATAAQRR